MPTITAGKDTPPAYDPAVASDGLSIDTDRGPVDLVVVWRVFLGQPAQVTPAEKEYLTGMVAQRPGTVVTPIIRALHVSGDTFKRAVDRRRAVLRAEGEMS